MYHALDELRHGGFKERQRLLVYVHHVSRLEIFHVNPVFDVRDTVSEVIHGVFRRKEWRRQIKVTVQDENIQVWVSLHDVGEVARYIRITHPFGLSFRLPIPLEVFVAVGVDDVCLVRREVQVGMKVIHEVRDEHRTYCRALGIVIRILS